jgi:hypothetical protein
LKSVAQKKMNNLPEIAFIPVNDNSLRNMVRIKKGVNLSNYVQVYIASNIRGPDYFNAAYCKAFIAFAIVSSNGVVGRPIS